MAKTLKSKKISITALDKVVRETQTPIVNVDWHGVEITVKNTLSFRDVLAFVDSVSKSCFSSATNAYLPEVKVFAIKCCVLEMYANFSLPANVEHKYDLVYNTDAFDVVLEHINVKQFNEIVDAINEKVKNMAQANAETINKQMNEIYAAFDGLQKQIEGIFSGISPEEISKFINAVSNGELNEDKLIQAYVKLNSNED